MSSITTCPMPSLTNHQIPCAKGATVHMTLRIDGIRKNAFLCLDHAKKFMDDNIQQKFAVRVIKYSDHGFENYEPAKKKQKFR